VRIVSLVPSVTESLLVWGIVPVAVTRWCEHPELPQVGGTKDPDVDAIVALAPDLVVLCEEENRLEDARALEAAGVAIHALRIRAVGDVGPELTALAARLGVAERWDPPVLPGDAPPATRRAFVPVWRERGRGEAATFTTLNDDTYGASVLRALGIANAFGDAASRYPTTTLAEAVARGADVVVAPSEPYPFGRRHVAELSEVALVVLVDGQDLFWWGVRTAAALERLADALAAR
jgi:ABC-type Fe3+-hydroxamate transport system substrate-binding protein